VEVKVFSCAIHGECTLGKELPQVTCCKKCNDYCIIPSEPPPPKIPAVSVIRPPVHTLQKTIVVIGAPRGGTSFITKILADVGVYMGEYPTGSDDYDCMEDARFTESIKAIMSLKGDECEKAFEQWQALEAIARELDGQHRVWGFKRPQSMFVIDRLLPLLTNPHIVIVLRDPLASLQSDNARGGHIPWSGARHHAAVVMDMLEKPRAPTLAVSYERGKEQPEYVKREVRRFVGSRPRRHLIYHCCPLTTNDLWERNVDQLLKRIHIFDGSVNIAVSTVANKSIDGTPDPLHPVDVVSQKFRGCGVHVNIIPVRNDRRLREVASFRVLLDRVSSRSSDDVTFYAHTKGNSTYDSVEGALYWRNMMYHKLLDNWEECMWHLRDHKAVGCSKMNWSSMPRSPFPTQIQNHHHWMFAGTFFWFRNDAVFTRDDWQKIQNDRYGAEAWPGDLFPSEECKSVFQPWPEHKFWGISPYDPQLYIKNGVAIEDVELRHPSYVI